MPEATVVPEVREEIAPDNDENTESGKVNTIPTARSAAVRAAPNWFYWAPLIALIGISVIVLIWLLFARHPAFPRLAIQLGCRNGRPIDIDNS